MKWAGANDELSVGEGMISSESRMRETRIRFDERRLPPTPGYDPGCRDFAAFHAA